MGEGSGVAMSCGVGRRRSSDLALLWLWHRPVATAPIKPLAWEPPYATGAALKRTKDKKKKKERKENGPGDVITPCLVYYLSLPTRM